MPAAPAPEPHVFLDNFFVGLVVLAGLLSGIDYLIGPTGRDRLRKKMGDWWVFVEETSFGEHLSQDARVLLEIYEELFEDRERFERWRARIFCVVFPGVIIMAGTEFVWFLKYGLGRPLAPGQVGASTHVLLLPMIFSAVAGIAGLWLVGWLLRVLTRTATAGSVVLSIAATAIYISGVATLICLSIILANIWEFLVRPLYQSNIVHSANLIEVSLPVWGHAYKFNLDPHISTAAAAFSAGSNVLVALMLVSLELFVGIAKMFSFVLKPVSSLLLRRFYESNQGVLTVIAVGGGALAKLGQELVKAVYQ
jgi:hypothetical protein